MVCEGCVVDRSEPPRESNRAKAGLSAVAFDFGVMTQHFKVLRDWLKAEVVTAPAGRASNQKQRKWFRHANPGPADQLASAAPFKTRLPPPAGTEPRTRRAARLFVLDDQ
jgi:hypothetical protein